MAKAIGPLTIAYFQQRSTVDHATGCWNWSGACSDNGYGSMRSLGRTMAAHRAVYQVANNVSLDGETHVCHRCDNRRCVNPEHLFAGTRSDNMQDCLGKGRFKTPCIPGSKLNAHVTAEQVLQIREDCRSNKMLAGIYGVDRSSIANIKSRRTWSDL